MSTIWKPIPQYSRYMASNDGRIMAIDACDNHKANYILKPRPKSKHPYPMYRVIGDDGKRRIVYLHHLIVRAFHGPKPFNVTLGYFHIAIFPYIIS